MIEYKPKFTIKSEVKRLLCGGLFCLIILAFYTQSVTAQMLPTFVRIETTTTIKFKPSDYSPDNVGVLEIKVADKKVNKYKSSGVYYTTYVDVYGRTRKRELGYPTKSTYEGSTIWFNRDSTKIRFLQLTKWNEPYFIELPMWIIRDTLIYK